jgi:hypothetical protein
MTSNIEVNGLAFIKVCIDQASDALTQEKLSEVRDLLLEMDKITDRQIDWLRRLAAEDIMLPEELTWSKYNRRRDARDAAKKATKL